MENDKIIKKKYGTISNLLYVISENGSSNNKIILILLITLVTSPFMQYMWYFVTKYIIDAISYGGSKQKIFIVILVGGIAYLIVYLLSIYVESDKQWILFEQRFNFLIKKNRKTLEMKYEYLENQKVLDCHYRAMGAATNEQEGLEGMMRKTIDFISIVSIVIAGMCILGNFNIYILITMLLLATVNFLIKNKVNAVCKSKIWDPMANTWRKVEYMKNLTSDFNYAKDIRMYGVAPFLMEKFKKINNSVYVNFKKNRNYWLIANEIGNLLWILAQAALYIWLTRDVLYNGMPIGNFTLYLASASTLFSYTSMFYSAISDLMKLSISVDDYRTFMDIENVYETDNSDVGKTKIKISDKKKYKIEFKNVSFKYPESDRYVLKDINLTINQGDRIAIVGVNGAGKTTFVNLMMNLYEPTEGTILVNGIDVRDVDRCDYYKIFAPVFQNINMYAFPLAQNVSMNDLKSTNKEKVKEALERAGLQEKIDELSKGIDTEILKIIYDDGVDLSGGEKQKVSIARAIYKNAEIIVLDEPTAALDAIAENKIYENFDKLINDNTAIYISHRLSSTRFCDKILMFEDGRIIESGTHDQLMKQKGKYEEMFELQSKYYKDENVG
ncbi:MAG: ABC transporter ATP-binding protein/permease [Lachnospiraceae bacterium]|nr:ABC transporter ATP-binding protein/permease [Lachnospiraceae bacterium]